jgi:antitoxin VapB
VPRTRAFKSGNSQAVRLPSEIAYKNPNIELEVSRVGDVVTIYPARPSLKDAVAQLKRMAKPPRVEKRQPIELPARKRD